MSARKMDEVEKRWAAGLARLAPHLDYAAGKGSASEPLKIAGPDGAWYVRISDGRVELTPPCEEPFVFTPALAEQIGLELVRLAREMEGEE